MPTGWIIVALGVVVGATPFLELLPSAYAWIDWIAGGVTLVVGVALAARRHKVSVLGILVGGWLVFAGFAPSLVSAPGLYWNNLVAGALLVVFGAAAARREAEVPARAP